MSVLNNPKGIDQSADLSALLNGALPAVGSSRVKLDGGNGIADTIQQHRNRWEEMQEQRTSWDREAYMDRKTRRGDVFNNNEKEVFRDQARDVPNYNLAMPMLQIVSGIEKQNRADIEYQPIGPPDVQGAQAATYIGRKVWRDNQGHRKTSAAFEEALTTGIGWLEIGQSTKIDADPIFVEEISSRDIWLDPACRKPDLSDCKDMCRAKYLTRSQLARIFPAFATQIEHLKGAQLYENGELDHSSDYTNLHGDFPDVNDGDFYASGDAQMDSRRNGRANLVQPVERWYRIDRRIYAVKHLDGRIWEVTKENAEALAAMVVAGTANEIEGDVTDIRYAVFCETLLLGDFPSPYSHRRFPFVPFWCYMDENGQPMGMMRLIRTAAKDFNARMANMLRRALTRQVWAEAGAFEDDDMAAEEMAMADGFVKMKAGGLRKVMVKDDLAASQLDADILRMDLKIITDLSGVTEELAGQTSPVESGVGIQTKINQAQTSLFTLLDNRNWALQRVGELLLSNIQDSYTAEQDIRITKSKEGIDWLTINKKDPTTGAILNDISQANCDVEIAEVPASASLQMAKFQALASFLGQMPPEVKMIFAPKLAELADIPDAADVAQQLTQFTQQTFSKGPMVHILERLEFKDLPTDSKAELMRESGTPSPILEAMGAQELAQISHPPSTTPPGPPGPPGPPMGQPPAPTGAPVTLPGPTASQSPAPMAPPAT